MDNGLWNSAASTEFVLQTLGSNKRRYVVQRGNSKHWHQLDLVLVRRKPIASVSFSRTFHSADGDTDHFLVLTAVQIPKQKRVKRKGKPKLNTVNMKRAENLEVFRESVEHGMADCNHSDVDSSWLTLKTVMYNSAKKAFGTQKKFQEDWMAENFDVLEPAISAKHTAYRAYNARATRLTSANLKVAQRRLRSVTRSCANDYWNKLCDEMQKAADTGNLRELYSGINKAVGPKPRKVCPLESKEGTAITDTNEQLLRWVEHYSELYGEPRQISDIALMSTPKYKTLTDLDDMPTLLELRDAMRSTASGRAPGADGIPADLLKCDASLETHLYNLLCLCWREKAFPSEMKDATITTLYKQKGDKGDCNNNRGISLMSVTGKICARVVLPRLQKIAEQIYPESQCGFRKSRSTVDMIFSVRKIQEKCREQSRPLHMAFVDFTKAFDMVSRDGLFAILQRLGCPPTLLALTRSLHDNMEATVNFEGST